MKEYEKSREKREGACMFDAIGFDLDSTIADIEGLDAMAKHKGCEAAIVELTRRSMEGNFDFQEAMLQKMKILSPSREDLLWLGKEYCAHIVPGAKDVIDWIHEQGKEVWILTGNFQPAVGMVAEHLGIHPARVIANRVFFDREGQYAGFDSNSPLARNGGKAIEIRKIASHEGKRVAFVGDGKTDLEVKPFVSLFIGFGGVAERQIVKEQSDVYISEPRLGSLINILKRR